MHMEDVNDDYCIETTHNKRRYYPGRADDQKGEAWTLTS